MIKEKYRQLHIFLKFGSVCVITYTQPLCAIKLYIN